MLDFSNAPENTWNFEVTEEVFPIRDKTDHGMKALIREDTGEILKVVPQTYTVLPHDDAVNAAYDAVKEADISKDVTIDIQCIDSGRKLKGTILFNDVHIEPVRGDHVGLEFNFFNSLDASWAYAQELKGLRLVCTNGMVSPEAIAATWARHTGEINVAAAVKQIAQGMDAFNKKKDVWASWTNIKVERNDCEEFFKATVAKRSSKENNTERFNQKQLEILLGQLDTEFQTLGRNKWALYNCLTHWSSHTDHLKTPAIAQRSREVKVAAAMTNTRWKAFA